MFPFITKWAAMNIIIEIHGNQSMLTLNTNIFSGFTALIMLCTCAGSFFQLFMRTFITFECRIIITWNLVSLCKNISSTSPGIYIAKALLFGWVIENSLGDYFFMTHSVDIFTSKIKFTAIIAKTKNLIKPQIGVIFSMRCKWMVKSNCELI